MISQTTTIHSRSHPASSGGDNHSMHYDEKPKYTFRTSHFYRTHIRTLKGNRLVYCIGFTLITLSIYYVTYWKDDNGGKREGDLGLKVGDGGRAEDGGVINFEKVNPKFVSDVEKDAQVEAQRQKVLGEEKERRVPANAPNRPDSGRRIGFQEDDGKVPADAAGRYQQRPVVDEKGPGEERVALDVRYPQQENRNAQGQENQNAQRQVGERRIGLHQDDGKVPSDAAGRFQQKPVENVLHNKGPGEERVALDIGHRQQENQNAERHDGERRKGIQQDGGKVPSDAAGHFQQRPVENVLHNKGAGEERVAVDIRYPQKENWDGHIKKDEKRKSDRGMPEHRRVFQAEIEEEEETVEDHVDVLENPSQHKQRAMVRAGGVNFPRHGPAAPEGKFVPSPGKAPHGVDMNKVAKALPDIIEQQRQKELEKIEAKRLAMAHDHEIDPDYEAVMEHNRKARDALKFPKYKDYKHADPNAPKNDELKPKPKDHLIGVLQEPNTKFCPSTHFILIVVVSTANDWVMRKTIRSTWGATNSFSHSTHTGLKWWAIHAVGGGTQYNAAIKEESEKYQDVLQGDFEDLDSEKTRKMIMVMRWVSELRSQHPNCRPTYMLKTETSVLVNMPKLVDWIHDKLEGENMNVYAGKVIRDDSPIRDPANPLFVPDTDYSGPHFPKLVQGPTVLFSTDVIIRMVTLFGVVTPIAMEDSYIGVLANQLGITPIDDDKFVHVNLPTNPCTFKYMMLLYNQNPTMIRYVYEVLIGKTEKHCSSDRGL